VAYVGGEAERLPLRDDSCAAAWLSTVIHHVGDLSGCAQELRRVLEPQAGRS
jgi:ubiquinone/menaquinone biosynthesis C-methylase UbiE